MTMRTGEPLKLKAPYPIADVCFPDGILPEHNTVFLGEGKGQWQGMWSVLVVGRFPQVSRVLPFVENPIFYIEPTAFTTQAQVDGL